MSSSYTLEAWVKPTALSGYQTILIKEADRRLRVLAADRRATAISSGFDNGGCREHVSSSPPLALNQWSHLAAVFNDAANTYTLYLNGTAVSDRRARPPRRSRTRRRSSFGQTGCSGCGFERWRGLIDDIRIYNRPLTAAEVQADMNTGV